MANHDECTQFAPYTDWCITARDSYNYDSYTCGDMGKFYICLRDSFEKEDRVIGEGCPLDRYGLSMIAVSVNFDGSCNTITSRWNHENKGDDHCMSVEQLEELLGVHFYQVFKPRTREELHAMGKILFDEVQGLLDSGRSPEDVFEFIGNSNDGYARVKFNGKYNHIDKSGRIISDKWWDSCNTFNEGYAMVYLNGKYNHIDQTGHPISDQWWDECGNFNYGYAVVQRNGKWNYIDTEGNLYGMNKQLIQRNPNPPLRPVQESIEWFRKLGLID